VKQIVPENTKGKSLDLEDTYEAESSEQAHKVFQEASQTLLNPELWKGIAGNAGATFTKWTGDKSLPVAIGDIFRIEIPGPSLKAGEGYDWVQVDDVVQESAADSSICSLTLQVTANPQQPENGVAHFFEAGATSTLILRMLGNKIILSYHGRNETPNTETPELMDKIRNTVVAAGALVGISELQWKHLLKSILKSATN
jgi:hypothetical protein